MVRSAGSTKEALVTGEELAAMGDIGRCELVDGRIFPMPPTSDEHGGVEVNFATALKAYATRRRSGKVRVGEVGIYTRRDPDRVRGAAVLFISNERHARRTSRAFLDVAPELVIEVLSPDDRAGDLMQKLREYFAIGVLLVWVADPRARVVRTYRSPDDVRELGERDVLTAGEVLPGFAVPVASLFED